MIDPTQLSSIAAGAPDLILQILADFHQESQERLKNLSGTLSNKNLQASGDLLHQLSGSSGTLGLSHFHQQSKAFEAQCLECKHPGNIVEGLSTLLDESVDRARQFLELA